MKLCIETLDQMHEHWVDYVDNVLSAINAMKLTHPDETAHHVLNHVEKQVRQMPYYTDTSYYVEVEQTL